MTNEPTPRGKSFFAAALAPETDAMLASDPPSDWPAFALALEIQRNAACAERDEHIARNNDSLLALHIATAERDAARAARNAARAERDALLAELATVNAERAESRGLRRCMIEAQDELAIASAENERLATANHSMEKEIPELRHALEKAHAERGRLNQALNTPAK